MIFFFFTNQSTRTLKEFFFFFTLGCIKIVLLFVVDEKLKLLPEALYKLGKRISQKSLIFIIVKICNVEVLIQMKKILLRWLKNIKKKEFKTEENDTEKYLYST